VIVNNNAVDITTFPNLLSWHQRIEGREPVKRAYAKAKTVQRPVALTQTGPEAEAARKLLFGQRAR
jgi:hypothetical protein